MPYRNLAEWAAIHPGSSQSSSRTPSSNGTLFLEDVKAYIRRFVTRELPGTVPYDAKVVLFTKEHARWLNDVVRYVQNQGQLVYALIKRLLDDTPLLYPELADSVRRMLHTLSHDLLQQCMSIIADQMEKERFPFVGDRDYYIECVRKYRMVYEMHPVPDYETELKLMAEGQAYIDIASARVYEMVTSTLHNSFLLRLSSVIEQCVMGDDGQLVHCVTEPETTQQP
ncbi:uncharacterized protein B0H18DRAFT_85804 [Fomitopsis serialis]|uniref:uncharacterized protein n=1 Tax=Fomitopsis serialis TaxID=139415 RepID=UPI002007E744|nr:uncharacterized protein B0H18DRAFT_85804 [Neoantrodia serialis]KAH9931493.1 hypothetical protein B0H18DRAFT_85804 [Neoantrodia serialis]